MKCEYQGNREKIKFFIVEIAQIFLSQINPKGNIFLFRFLKTYEETIESQFFIRNLKLFLLLMILTKVQITKNIDFLF